MNDTAQTAIGEPTTQQAKYFGMASVMSEVTNRLRNLFEALRR